MVSAVFIGNESLMQQCAEGFAGRGGLIGAVVTRSPEIATWAREKGLEILAPGPGLAQDLARRAPDWILSVANLDILPPELLATARQGAINFHDGPLPAHAGLNAPVWALIEGAERFGITWHVIEAETDTGIDTGDIVAQEHFDIAPGETALTLNAKCFEAGLAAFERVLDGLFTGDLPREPQDLGRRSYHARDKRPPAMGALDFARPAEELARLVRALDHGGYWNPLNLPRIVSGSGADRAVWLVTRAEAEAPTTEAAPGQVLDIRADSLLVACGQGAIRLSGLCRASGAPVEVVDFVRAGEVLPAPDREALDRLAAALAPHDAYWHKRLGRLQPARLPLARPGCARGAQLGRTVPLPAGLAGLHALAACAAFAARLAGAEAEQAIDLAFRAAETPRAPGHASGWVPLGVSPAESLDALADALEPQVGAARTRPGFAQDLALRAPELSGLAQPDLGLSEAGAIEGCALTLALNEGTLELIADDARLTPEALELIAERAALFLAEATQRPQEPLATLPIIPEAERRLMLETWNETDVPIRGPATIAEAFEAQAARSPEATALVFEGRSLSYDALDRAANQLAHALVAQGVGPGRPVGLHLRRSLEMMIGALGILKAGGAYVPMDPAFPPERLAHYLADSGAELVVTERALAGNIAGAKTLCIDDPATLAAMPETSPGPRAGPEDLAYVIYTSGSTGTPKGVMVEHRNVANFFTGMDRVIEAEDGATWLAVTSMSFDISVLELFYTLARGHKVVLAPDLRQAMLAGPATPNTAHSERPMDFSLFFWGNDDGVGRQKYALLLDSARFADANGFRAVWTPERHFHAFGGPYPNPAVTGAAVAAVTRNLDVRAGSCVAPLHHPARIAEEWAVIDNLTEGRVGIGIASGWQPHDFVLRPENTPPANKPAMLDTIDKLRRLWRGEPVAFAQADGSMHEVVTQPRPVSGELPIWVTTAGNPETWREAGAIGANVLTHLLGQTIEEVGEKIRLYHEALHKAGHDPAERTVTLMLHTYLAETREEARARAEGPMKDYLRSAAGLIKQFAWAFPAFKRPKGVSNPFELDLEVLEPEDMEAILDFAFTRYFEDSGLFGTVEDALARTEELKAIGVDEIACLIDYGIEREHVLESLKRVARVVARANQPVDLAPDDVSIAAQIRRHAVSHMQMTPSTARMLTLNEATRGALAGLRHLYLGGEALPGALVSELESITRATITNMYGPTETTIWSLTGPAEPGDATANIGRPIANTRAYVLDAQMQPVPIGQAGELWIGGMGVTRGYHGRPELTSERFRPDPFRPGERIYRTGDLVRQRLDGRLDFLGRSDHQVKLRGFRIELGEIEARLEAAAGCPAVVLAHEARPGDTRLTAWLAGAAPDDAALKARLARDLPDYMIPTRFVRLERFPLTPNGKIDRAALPHMAESAEPQAEVVPFAPPADDTEARIAEVWSQVLGVSRIGARDNFFNLGGHSLLAVQAHRQLRGIFPDADLSITDIFRHPTLGALAERLRGAPTAPPQAPASRPTQGETAPAVGQAETRAAARAEAMSRRRAMRANRRR